MKNRLRLTVRLPSVRSGCLAARERVRRTQAVRGRRMCPKWLARTAKRVTEEARAPVPPQSAPIAYVYSRANPGRWNEVARLRCHSAVATADPRPVTLTPLLPPAINRNH